MVSLCYKEMRLMHCLAGWLYSGLILLLARVPWGMNGGCEGNDAWGKSEWRKQKALLWKLAECVVGLCFHYAYGDS